MKNLKKMTLSGFTLIELLIVIAIIGILAAIAIPNFLGMRARAQVSACASALAGVKTAQEVFMTDNDSYAASLAALNVTNTRVYIEQAKVLKTCNTASTVNTAAGFNITGTPQGKYQATCNLLYTESNNSTTGTCG